MKIPYDLLNDKIKEMQLLNDKIENLAELCKSLYLENEIADLDEWDDEDEDIATGVVVLLQNAIMKNDKKYISFFAQNYVGFKTSPLYNTGIFAKNYDRILKAHNITIKFETTEEAQ